MKANAGKRTYKPNLARSHLARGITVGTARGFAKYRTFGTITQSAKCHISILIILLTRHAGLCIFRG
jgi:hypothetical protein